MPEATISYVSSVGGLKFEGDGETWHNPVDELKDAAKQLSKGDRMTYTENERGKIESFKLLNPQEPMDIDAHLEETASKMQNLRRTAKDRLMSAAQDITQAHEYTRSTLVAQHPDCSIENYCKQVYRNYQYIHKTNEKIREKICEGEL